MKGTRSPILLSVLSFLIVLVLVSGCYRPAAPDVELTPAETEETTPSDEDIVATAAAESTRVAEAEAEAVAEPEEEVEATEEGEPAEAEPQPTDTPVPPAAEPTAVPDTPTPEPTAIPPATPVPPTPIPTTVPPSGGTTGTVTHVVQRGENMFRIALRYGTTVQAIASANGIANPARISVGQRLIIPSAGAQPAPQPVAGTTYVVQPGDNLFRIALRFNMSHLYLAQYNGIPNSSRIYVGQVIRIPPR